MLSLRLVLLHIAPKSDSGRNGALNRDVDFLQAKYHRDVARSWSLIYAQIIQQAVDRYPVSVRRQYWTALLWFFDGEFGCAKPMATRVTGITQATRRKYQEAPSLETIVDGLQHGQQLLDMERDAPTVCS